MNRPRTLYIKNMVCTRCIKVVVDELENLGVDVLDIKLGEATVTGLDDKMMLAVKEVLYNNGFELIDDKKARIIEKVKTEVISLIQKENNNSLHVNYSTYLEEKLGLDYHTISSLFSSMESLTLEKYIILQKIEKAKELLVYDELTLSEIADRMGYSSVHHLSNQFKKVTGLTPTHFKKIKEEKRKPLDKVG